MKLSSHEKIVKEVLLTVPSEHIPEKDINRAVRCYAKRLRLACYSEISDEILGRWRKEQENLYKTLYL